MEAAAVPSSCSSSSQAPKLKELPDSGKHHILVASCGSADATKFAELCLKLAKWADVVAVATHSALRFIDRDALASKVVLLTDDDEGCAWKRDGDNVRHIDPCEWAHVMVIAPLSANTLAKIAGGMCVNLLTSIVRAWNGHKKTSFIAPSMHPCMWRNQFTEKQLEYIDDMGFTLILPTETPLPSGEQGCGPMAKPSAINNTLSLRWFLEH